MTATNSDFFIHVLFLLYKEIVEERIISKGRELNEEFWDLVESEVIPVEAHD